MRCLNFLLFVLLLVVMGCSSGSNTPLTPQSSESTPMTDNLPIIGASLFEDGSFNALGMLGAYELSINPEYNSAELVAKRTSAIGESYVVSGIGFFTISPCSNCLKLNSIELNPDGNVILIFSISHPFEKGDILKPPSAINRLDLDVFDLALIVAPQETTAINYSLTGVSVYNSICVEADGYTTELAEMLEDSAAMPYSLVIDDSIGGTGTYNKFEMATKDFEFNTVFDLSSGVLRFDLYLTMGYGFSAVKANRLNPAYYNPEFNRKSAWKVDVTPPEGENPPAVGNTWSNTDNTTAYNVTVEVYDWQIGANVDVALTNPTDIYAASDVTSVSVEIPGMNATLQSVSTADSGLGTPDDPLVYTLSIANENLLPEGEYTGFVKVTDERAVGTIGDRDFLIDSPDGVNLVNYNLPEFTTYQTFTATVVIGSTIELTAPNGGEEWSIGSNQNITWTTTLYSGNIKLEYSKDGFVADINEIIASTDDDGVYEWEIPDDESETVRVRATLVDAPTVYDDSDADFSITFSLDEMIVYCARGPEPGTHIFSIDPEGVGPVEQWTSTDYTADDYPKLSPCGGYIMYIRFTMAFIFDVRIIDIEASTDTVITPTGLNASSADFSHDGTTIVAGLDTSWFGPFDLWTFDYEGNNAVQITTGQDVFDPEYNFDDTKIYYTNGLSSSEIRIYDVASGVITNYTNNGASNCSPHGSPDGTQIAWETSYNGGGRKIYISPIGSWNPPDKIIDFNAYVRYPCFSPDGTKMVVDYGSYDGIELAVCDITVDPITWTRITDNTWTDSTADWGVMIPH